MDEICVKNYGYLYKLIRTKRELSILDFGTGTGLFLYKLKIQGHNVVGSEYSGKMRSFSKKIFGLESYEPDLIYQRRFRNKFDFIFLNNVLEHLENPFDVVKKLSDVLKTNGKIVIVTPNSSSLGHLIFGRHWYHLDPGRHLYIFNFTSLKVLLNLSGFKIKHEKHGYYLHNFSGIFESARHFFKNNYEIKKTEDLIYHKNKNIINYFKNIAIYFFKFLSFSISLLESIIKRGEVITVYAEKY